MRSDHWLGVLARGSPERLERIKMKTWSNHLDHRSEARQEAQKRQERGDIPFIHGAPEERILKFDAWVRAELRKRLVWNGADAEIERRVEQCRIELDRPVLELWRRGWLLDGHRLAAHIIRLLDAVGAAQRKGQVGDFWPYYRAAVSRYVGANAEEIQLEARSAGAIAHQVLASIVAKPGTAGAPSLPELIAQRKDETLREKVSRERKAAQREESEKAQMKLL